MSYKIIVSRYNENINWLSPEMNNWLSPEMNNWLSPEMNNCIM